MISYIVSICLCISSIIVYVSGEYSALCASNLTIFNANSSLIQAQINWNQVNRACIAAAADLPTTWGTYVVNCNKSIEDLEIACFSMGGNFCSYIGTVYLYNTSAYYKFNLWDKSCLPSACMEPWDRQQLGRDITNMTYDIFPQCSDYTCIYSYEYSVQCETNLPSLSSSSSSEGNEDNLAIPSWAIAVIIGSVFSISLVVGLIIVLRKKYYGYTSLK
jgi:hypothetical protein